MSIFILAEQTYPTITGTVHLHHPVHHVHQTALSIRCAYRFHNGGSHVPACLPQGYRDYRDRTPAGAAP